MNSSTITGTVTDSTGARIPGAKVVVTNQATGVATTTVTTSGGIYNMPYLISGIYKVEVSANGFAVQTAEGATVGNNATAHVDLTLKTGAAETTVQVDGSISALQTEDTSVKTSIGAEQIDALPNINQNPLIYATLQPGVAAQKTTHYTQGTDSFGVGPHARRTQSLISINGGLGFTTDIQLDGIPILASDYNEEGIVPNEESIQEVQVQSNTFSSEYGRGTGIVEYFSKSGTNAFHGEAIYRIRNEDFNANGFTNNFNHFVAAQTNPTTQTGVRSKFRVNYFGGSLGGPIIPDRLFFFASYEGLSRSAPINKNITVPTALQRAGDFSCTDIADNNGSPTPVTIYNPYSATQVAPNVYKRPVFAPGNTNCSSAANLGGGSITGGSVIPAANLDPVGVKAFSNYPLPNQAATDAFGDNNYNVRTSQNFIRNTGQMRVDYKVNNHNTIYLTGGIAQGSVIVPNFLGANNPFYPSITWGQTITDDNPYAAIGDTVIFSPTLVLDVRYGVNRMQSVEGYGPKASTFDLSGYNQPSQITSLIQDPTQPFDFCATSNFTCLNYTVGQHIDEHQTNHSFNTSITKTHGDFTFKVGGEYRVGLLNTANPVHANFSIGNLYYDQNYTAQYTDALGNNVGAYNTTNVQQGFQAAQFLLGAGYEVAGSSVASALAMKYGAFYEQTTWKATPKLTLNFGLRFELQPGPTERYNQQVAFDTQGTNSFADGKGAYVFSGTNGYSRNLYQNHFQDYGPRVGIAYNIDQSTVIRGGYGIAYLPTNSGFGFSSQNSTAFTTHNVIGAAAVFGANPNGVPIGKFYDAAVSGSVVPALGATPNNALQYGGSNGYLADYRNTYDGRLMQWNVFLEKSFAPRLTFSLGYSASRGDHLPFSNLPVNGAGANGTGTTPPGFQTISPGTLSSWRQQYISSNGTNPSTLNVANPYAKAGFQGGVLSANTIAAWRLLVPYQAFPDLNLLDQHAHSNYQSMVVDLRKTLSHGFEIDGNFVWSKEIDDAQNIGQSNDAFNNAGEQNTGYLLNLNQDTYDNRHVGYNDITNRAVITTLFDSPFGPNKTYFAHSKLAGWTLGGWRLGTSFQAQTGTPIEITSSMGSLNNRPNRVPGMNPILSKEYRHFYYNKSGSQTVQLGNGATEAVSCSACMPYLNPLAFTGPTVTTPNGSIKPDVFWYGNGRVTYDDIRSPNVVFFDAQLQREFPITERVHLSLAANAFNALNLTEFLPIQAISVGTINTSVTATRPIGASSPTTQSLGFYDPRQLQLQARINF